jgi:hypothetical protein
VSGRQGIRIGPSSIETLFQNREQTRELRENEDLMSSFDHLLKLRQQRVDLRAGSLDLLLSIRPGWHAA